MSLAYIALGSNLSNPVMQVKRALAEIDQIQQTKRMVTSSLYATTPVGYDNQPGFINAVTLAETALSPTELLSALFEIEDKHGRERPFPNAPRVLDLDLLVYDTLSMQTKVLTLPHPRMHERGFVMQPLAEIAPNLNISNFGTAQTLAAQCAGQGVVKLDESTL